METIMTENKTYLANSAYAARGAEALHAFLKETDNPMETTTSLLLNLLRDNKDTEYGRRYDFAGIHTIEDYQKKVPVIVYDNIAPDLERMKNGETNILTAYPFRHFNETSGTIGTPKVVPMTDPQEAVFEKYSSLLVYGILKDQMDEDWMKGRAFCTTGGTYRTLESGLTVGEAAAMIADYFKGGKHAMDTMLRTVYTSPIEAVTPLPTTDSKYIHARFALMDKDLKGIISGFYSVTVLFLKYIANNHELLINDIEKGTISEEIEMPYEVRQSLMEKIQPMPERAGELREIFKNGAEFPFVRKIWPDLRYLMGAGGDGFEIYDKQIKEQFTGGGVANIYFGITASEGLWSVPSGIDDHDSILAPGAAFVEFLPVEAGDDFSKCVTMDKLKVGGVYELIITNLCGFYRYRMSDAVIVTGFYNNTPKVQFMYRVNRTINLMEEKTTEKALQITVEKTCEEMGIELSDFSVYPDSGSTPNNYVFLIEPRKEIHSFDMETLRDCLLKNLCKANPVYLDCYNDHWLGKPEVYFLQPETSLLYRDMMVMQGASLSQLKPVRVIMNEKQRKFFFGLRQLEHED